ncbi:RNA-binding cell elongation regulator Jag/EloR [Streptococcus plurextorum]|uniref:RNA-binding cell elongation regulator Jag/EloR n=1 Tax=Streptococcus plurextorum TaxID=456876 RepID=UPI000428EA6B|nr:RNA-binding cell elongation regulator Jag/EloR [Streptococcus plurextorum]
MVIFTGKTVEEAIEAGLRELNLPRMKAHIRVVAREKKGFLGFGKKPAQVDIENIDEKTAHKADQKAVKGVPDEINQKNAPVTSSLEDTIELSKVTSLIKEMEARGELEVDQEVKEQFLVNKKSPQTILEETGHFEVLKELQVTEEASQKVEEAPEEKQADKDDFQAFVDSEFSQEKPAEAPTADIEEAAQAVKSYVETIIYEMDVEASFEIHTNRRDITIQIETPDAGRVIGYHGKVLKSLQLLAQNFLHDHYSRYFSVSLNVHDYLEHRTGVVIDFTKKMAKRVLETGQDYVMDPMSNSERKIVHKTVSKIAGVESYSEGDDPNRYVVISRVD